MRSNLKFWFIIAGAALIAACGGGGTTEQLQQPTATSQSTYTGPAPATAEAQAFMINVWENLRPGNGRCGECHSNGGGQSPLFARDDDVNLAWQAANALADLGSPADSRLVTKVAGGHNCWLGSAQACADIMTTWIEGWAGVTGSNTGRQIQLQAPVMKSVGASRNFPATSGETIFGFPGGLHDLLTDYCSDCHAPDGALMSQPPYFADGDVDAAYAAVQTKIDLNNPASSRLVLRLFPELHNCWGDCQSNSAEMQAAIQALADPIPVTQVDPSLVVSRALTLYDGIVAAGGNRYEANQIVLYEFKEGPPSTIAYDTSGVDPAIDLTLSGDVSWVGGWGIDIKDGKAQGSTTASKKIHDLIQATGEYSIEAWVVPGNVVQDDTRIISYSAGTTSRNFNLGQTLYAYDFFNRSTLTDANGQPGLSTAAADEDLQATLQHVVMTYSPIDGRRIYVNGIFTDDLDTGTGGTLADWDDSFALVLGNEVSGDRQWVGQLRLVAVHNRVLSPEQIQQNLDVGVGEKFFLLFFVGDLINVPEGYILFEVSQFDSYSYLFNSPTFISLDPAVSPANISVRGMRIGVNGIEATVGQAYQNLDVTLNGTDYDPATGQALSSLGTVINLQQGPDSDEFFLSFEVLGSNTNIVVEGGPLLPPPLPTLPPASEIGLKTFDAINATMSEVTGIPTDEPNVKFTFDTIRQSLPAVPDIATFLSSHEIGIAQLAIEYCNALIEDVSKRAGYFPDFDFSALPATAFSAPDRDDLIDPLIERMTGQVNGGTNIASQPGFSEIKDELGVCAVGGACLSGCCPNGEVSSVHDNLVDRLLASASAPNTTQRTENIAKAICAAALGNGAMLIQ
jgi:mono/diheme cytochrome c family protein